MRINQHFVLFIHHIWGETVIWGAVFILQISDKMQYFTIFQEKLPPFNIQNHRSPRGLLAKPFKKTSKITYSASRFSLLTSAKFSVNIKRVTLQNDKEFIVFIFLFNGFITMCNLKKRLIRAAFWVLLQAMFMNDWKQHSMKMEIYAKLKFA